jgi:hypothetical protein
VIEQGALHEQHGMWLKFELVVTDQRVELVVTDQRFEPGEEPVALGELDYTWLPIYTALGMEAFNLPRMMQRIIAHRPAIKTGVAVFTRRMDDNTHVMTSWRGADGRMRHRTVRPHAVFDCARPVTVETVLELAAYKALPLSMAEVLCEMRGDLPGTRTEDPIIVAQIIATHALSTGRTLSQM